ncbi:MAG: inositol monophosphatase family protein [Chloroflexota bacterium]
MDLPQTLHYAVETAKAAGALLREGVRQQKHVQRKSSAVDLITEYDERAESLIVERLRAAFPGHRLVTEEGTSDNSGLVDVTELTWYVDPLDGTNNFVHGFPFFAVSLALYEGERPLLGIIYDPLRNECFRATRGGGAYLDTGGGPLLRLGVSQETRLLDSLLATGFPYDRHTNDTNLAEAAAFLKRSGGVRRAGAAALDLAYVAAGRLDGYWEFRLHSWDVAAGALLVTEAGGQVTNMSGQPLTLTHEVSLIASNGRIHPAILDVIEEVAGSR